MKVLVCLALLMGLTACSESPTDALAEDLSYLFDDSESSAVVMPDERLEACALILGDTVSLEECLGDTLPEFFDYIVDYRPCDAFFLPSYGNEEDDGLWTEEDYSFFAQVVLINRNLFDDGRVEQEEVWEMALPRTQIEWCERWQI